MMTISKTVALDRARRFPNKHGTKSRTRTNHTRFFRPVLYLMSYLGINLVPRARVELAELFLLREATLPDLSTGAYNTLFPMCVLKHSSWMNPRVSLRIENALIRCDLSLHKRSFIPQAARFPMFQVRGEPSLLHTVKDKPQGV